MNLFKEVTCLKRPHLLFPNGDLLIQVWLYLQLIDLKIWTRLWHIRPGCYGVMTLVRLIMPYQTGYAIISNSLSPLLHMQNVSYSRKVCNIKRLLHDIFLNGPGISPNIPYQARQQSWSADMGRGLIPGTVWKISCHNLFITYFTLTFSKHWLLYCKNDLWTDKLRK